MSSSRNEKTCDEDPLTIQDKSIDQIAEKETVTKKIGHGIKDYRETKVRPETKKQIKEEIVKSKENTRINRKQQIYETVRIKSHKE